MTEDELILTHILKCSRIELHLHKPQLTPAQQKRFDSIRRRRTKGEPLQYLLGDSDFMGITFKVDPRVFIPRPETELLVETALKRMAQVPPSKEGLYALDIGTGSGNIPIALLKHNPNWRVVSLDVSQDALDLAVENAREHGVLAGIKFIHADVFEWLNAHNPYPKHFSVVISNPPYVTTAGLAKLPADVKKEPKLALDGGKTGLKFYEHLIANVPHVLKPGGWLFLEIGEDQRKSLENLLTAQGSFVNIETTTKDYAGRDRIVAAQFKI
jgi:release factor glutamine methyltransferase